MVAAVDEGIGEAVRLARERIDAAARRGGRTAADVRVLAVSKYVDAATVTQFARAGITDIAENRLESLHAKRAELATDPDVSRARWHFIGRLQSRQAAAIAAEVDAIHSLCSPSAARRLAAVATATDGEPAGSFPVLLVQVNVDADPAKDGVAAADLDRFLTELPEPLRVGGLMTMPAFAADAEGSRAAFASLRELAQRLAAEHAGRHELRELSMGTSQDFEVAVEEGATLVRLGRVLYAAHA
jgi:pyridoxal phosphate enzyme (YggS family)